MIVRMRKSTTCVSVSGASSHPSTDRKIESILQNKTDYYIVGYYQVDYFVDESVNTDMRWLERGMLILLTRTFDNRWFVINAK